MHYDNRHSSPQIIDWAYSQSNISCALNQVQWPYLVLNKCSNHKVITDCDYFSITWHHNTKIAINCDYPMPEQHTVTSYRPYELFTKLNTYMWVYIVANSSCQLSQAYFKNHLLFLSISCMHAQPWYVAR